MIYIIILYLETILSSGVAQKCLTTKENECGFPYEYKGIRFDRCITRGTEGFFCPVHGPDGNPVWETCKVDNCSASLMKGVLLNSNTDLQKKNIVNGVDAMPNEFPFIVGIHHLDTPICGGSIVADQWILSAGHCAINFKEGKMIDGRNLVIHVALHDISDRIGNITDIWRKNYNAKSSRRRFFNGAEGKNVSETPKKIIGKHLSSEENVYKVATIITHGSFNIGANSHDFSLFQTKRKIAFAPWVSAVSLDTRAWDPSKGKDPLLGMSSYVAGWGKVNESSPSVVLQKTILKILDINKCNEIFGEFKDTPVCAVGQDSSAYIGDSGGPLMIKENEDFTQIGVISFGQPFAFNSTMPSVFSRVSQEIEWIKCITKGKLGAWTEWAACDETCGDIFKQIRFRDCVGPEGNIIKHADKQMI